MAADYLVASANEMYLSLTKQAEPTLNDLANASSRGCQALRTLADDPEFKEQVEVLADWRRTNSTEFDFMTGRHLTNAAEALEHLSYFLKIEKDLLIANGMRPDLVETLIGRAMQSIKTVQDFGQNIDALFVTIDSSRYVACDLADRLNQQRSQHENKANTKNLLLRITNGIGGSAIIAINVVAAAVLTPVGSAVSGAIGAALVGTMPMLVLVGA